MKTILLQLDTDPQPSVFDAVVAVDSGVDALFRHGGVTPENVRELVHGCLFTRAPADLKHTAIFVGGSNVQRAEEVLKAVRSTFFGPFSVSVMLDPNGANTTAAAAILALEKGAAQIRGSLAKSTVAILAATGPVGERVARLVLSLTGEDLEVRVGSRSLEKAQGTAARLPDTANKKVVPFGAANADELRRALDGVDFLVSAGAAGVTLLPKSVWQDSSLKVVIDLNAVPPLGIEGVEATDKAKQRDNILAWGALGVGGAKMRIHKRAIAALFESNTQVLDAESILELGKTLG